MFKVDTFNALPLAKSFDRLPVDEYTPGGFRERRLGNFKVNWDFGHMNFKQVGSSLMQPADINSYLGDIERTYEPLEDDVAVHSPIFRLMVLKMQDMTGWRGDFDCHQIRIRAKDGMVAEPAPEGIHRDGYEFIVPFMVRFVNVKGGQGQVWDNEGTRCLLNMRPIDNTVLMFEDRKVKHFGAPISQRDPEHDALWDVFVFACNPDGEDDVQAR